MAETRPVLPPSPRSDAAFRLLVGSVVVGLAIAQLKPWSWVGDQPQPTQSPRPSPSLAVVAEPSQPAESSQPAEWGRYDPRMFGKAVPPPAWELWPAGYVVTFGFAGPVGLDGSRPAGEVGLPPDVGGRRGSSSEPPATPSPTPTPSLAPTPTPTAPPAACRGATCFEDGSVIDLGFANHIIVLGVNVPLRTATEIRLFRLEPDRQPERVRVIELPSPWSVDWFHVIAPATADGRRVADWQAGTYRLDVVASGTGAVARSITFLIHPSTDASPAP